MKNNNIKDFFDGLAPRWDEAEHTSDERILSLLERIGIKKGDVVLDVACGTGRITGLLHGLSGADGFGVDISEKMIDLAKEKYKDQKWAHFECADFCEMSGDRKYDVIFLYNAYPHFLEPEKLNEALKKNLKTNGLFAIVHSMGRKQLHHHHEHVPFSVSRDLEQASVEAERFAKDFRILLAEEDDGHYLIIGKKR